MNQEYKLVLGLEIHLQLNTKTKMFCGCEADIWQAEPNSHTCPVCLGLPGALPVPNKDVVYRTQMLGMALGCDLAHESRFDRKHYFYPDLPKGYQISQYKKPLCENGSLQLDNDKIITLERIHLEEDTAKSFHEQNKTLIDFNKSGIPLVEIVTKPVFTSTDEAVEFCKKIQQIVRYLGISEVDMEKGQMRLEANISVRTQEMEKNNQLPDYKVEVKNINSFRFMEKAVKSEFERQSKILSEGGKLIQENRGYDEATGKTVSQRSKEDAHDYRYFPEPDIPPMQFDDEYFLDLAKNSPKIPQYYFDLFTKKYDLDKVRIKEFVYSLSKQQIDKFITILNLMQSQGLTQLNDKAFKMYSNKPELRAISEGEFLQTFGETLKTDKDETKIEILVDRVLYENTKAVQDFRSGKPTAVQFLVGQVMRQSESKLDIEIVKKILENKLNGIKV